MESKKYNELVNIQKRSRLQVQRTNQWLLVVKKGKGQKRGGEGKIGVRYIIRLQGYIAQQEEYSQYFVISINGV